MVTSYLDSRKTIGNRGSKSNTRFILIFVKEQRVDGSWYGKVLLYLRCTLIECRKAFIGQNPF